ncbi:MAG: IPT/TIG domain-containing protein [Treponema sp.]|nr:IPT/TIG domain-containing protein [Treponema sp.]
MNSTGRISYIFRKSPLVRSILLLIILGLAVTGIFIFTIKTTPTPEIDYINPPVGNPGDIVVIKGKNFGHERDMNYVEFSGNRLTASNYISWTDDTIKVIIPANIQNGLVVVGNAKHRSRPSFFANLSDIPVEVQAAEKSTLPLITELDVKTPAIGDLVVISGNNFGDSRGTSRVLWTCDYDGLVANSEYPSINDLTKNMIACSELESDYVRWGNNSISVRVPSGASSGVLIVETDRGSSEPYYVDIDTKVGTKEFGSKHTFVVQYVTEVSNISATGTGTITLRCPIPATFELQPEIENAEIVPSPTIDNFHQTVIHQLNVDKNTVGTKTFLQTFVIPVYEVKTHINGSKVYKNYSYMNQTLFDQKTAPSALVPADNEKIVELAAKIIGKETNNYRKARLVYDYMVKEYKYYDRERKPSDDPVDLLRRERGDAYDFAVVYCALLRALKIPCIVDSGLLIDQGTLSKTHFWNEFYVAGFGWVPVDVTLACGEPVPSWTDAVEDPVNYYFGNLDCHRITFSRDLNDIKPFSHDSKVETFGRTYALQSFWEETTGSVERYSSDWSSPVISGIY